LIENFPNTRVRRRDLQLQWHDDGFAKTHFLARLDYNFRTLQLHDKGALPWPIQRAHP